MLLTERFTTLWSSVMSVDCTLPCAVECFGQSCENTNSVYFCTVWKNTTHVQGIRCSPKGSNLIHCLHISLAVINYYFVFISECVLEKPYAFHSQGGEDFFIFSYFFSRPLKCGGTFVEMGAYDGLHLSISLFFERHLNWKGLLIEANPEYYELLVKNRPNATSLGAAAGDCPGGVINFTGEGVFGHLLYEKIDTYFRPGNKPVIQVPCLPLGSLLKRAGLTEIDFFILDVEGSEYSALKTMDWSISVKVWIVEIAHTPPKPIIDIFAEHGYYDSGINFTKECKSISIDPELLVAPKHHCTPAIIFVRKQGL